MTTTKTHRHSTWSGMLCHDTRQEISERMHDLLAGQRFTYVACNSFSEESERFTSVDVHPSQWLMGDIADYNDPELAGLSWRIPDFSMGVHTDARTQEDGRTDKPHGYVHFWFQQDRLTIDHYAPAGYTLRWIFVREHRWGNGPFSVDLEEGQRIGLIDDLRSSWHATDKSSARYWALEHAEPLMDEVARLRAVLDQVESALDCLPTPAELERFTTKGRAFDQRLGIRKAEKAVRAALSPLRTGDPS